MINFLTPVPVMSPGVCNKNCSPCIYAGIVKARLRALWALKGLGARVSSQRLEMIGVCRVSAGESFRFVRARARAVWLPSGIGSEMKVPPLVPFSCDLWELALFFFWLWGLYLFSSHHPANLLSKSS